jgi:hypothetical protein
VQKHIVFGSNFGANAHIGDNKNKAISIAERLFKSVARLGRLEVADLSPDQLESLQSLHRISFIEQGYPNLPGPHE